MILGAEQKEQGLWGRECDVLELKPVVKPTTL